MARFAPTRAAIPMGNYAIRVGKYATLNPSELGIFVIAHMPDLARQSAEDAAAAILNARTQPDQTTSPNSVVHLPGTSSR